MGDKRDKVVSGGSMWLLVASIATDLVCGRLKTYIHPQLDETGSATSAMLSNGYIL